MSLHIAEDQDSVILFHYLFLLPACFDCVVASHNL